MCGVFLLLLTVVAVCAVLATILKLTKHAMTADITLPLYGAVIHSLIHLFIHSRLVFKYAAFNVADCVAPDLIQSLLN